MALNRVVTDRDALEATMKTQVDALEETSRACIQLQGQLDTAHRELKRRGEEMKQLSLQWDILLRTIRDLRTKAQAQQRMLQEKTQEIDLANQQIALLTEERAESFTLRYRPRGKLWQRFTILSGGRF